jgi:hypothetical protein
MTTDNETTFWTTLKWPAAPNEHDYQVFEQYSAGRILLLGSTKLLLPLCTEAWDLAPRYSDTKIKNKDWFTINEHWDTIILDGGLAYGKEFTKRLLPIVLAHCDRFVARAFLNPDWPTKYAVYFPKAEELIPQPAEHPINDIYTFYIWNNKQS